MRTQPFTLIATSFWRFAGQKYAAHVEWSIVHAQRLSQSFVKSQLSRAKCGRQFKRGFASIDFAHGRY